MDELTLAHSGDIHREVTDWLGAQELPGCKLMTILTARLLDDYGYEPDYERGLWDVEIDPTDWEEILAELERRDPFWQVPDLMHQILREHGYEDPEDVELRDWEELLAELTRRDPEWIGRR